MDAHIKITVAAARTEFETVGSGAAALVAEIEE